MINVNNTIEDLSVIYTALKVCKKYDLETEVVLYAIQNIKKNPEQTIEEAFAEALNEWIK